jgi:hypothetical protein
MLMAPVNIVRQLVGELMAIGLVVPLTQATGASAGFAQPGMQAVQPPQVLYSGQTGSHRATPPQTGRPGVQPQWGNGNTNATFMAGGGWTPATGPVAPQSGQPGGAYASATGYR